MTTLALAYESTVDEGVDLQMKVLERSRIFARAWAQIAIIAPGAGLATAISLFAMPPAARVIGAVATALIVGATYIPFQRRLLRRRLRDAALEARGGDVALPIKVSIDDTGIHSSCRGESMSVAWDEVEDVVETDDAIEIYAADGGLTRLPHSAFPNRDSIETFLSRFERAG